MKKSLGESSFEYRFIDHFPGDTSREKRPRQTEGCLYSLVDPTPSPDPKLISASDSLADELGLRTPLSHDDILLLSGNSQLDNMKPYAYRYGGHQFGHWADQLGDGRAINLGELKTSTGQYWEMQLKGSGLTPYSRGADGKAVLRSSVREFLMSEAMHYLGVPTTRALSLVTTGENVVRDMFYNGKPAEEKGAIVCRVSPSFLRFGNFEILAARQDLENLQGLVNFSVEHFFPEIDIKSPRLVFDFFSAVFDRTLEMIVHWQRVGFTHGVMNTDNMSIHGLTIDYGPYSMLDHYDNMFTPNTTDLPGRRYAFGRQPSIALWNLDRFALALRQLDKDIDLIDEKLNSFQEAFTHQFLSMMEDKLGLPNNLSEGNQSLIKKCLELLQEGRFDYTLFFKTITDLRFENCLDKENFIRRLKETSYKNDLSDSVDHFVESYLSLTQNSSCEKMKLVNPCFILRNSLLFEAIEKLENGDDSFFFSLFDALQRPYSSPEDKKLIEKSPDWAFDTPGCSTLSCSS